MGTSCKWSLAFYTVILTNSVTSVARILTYGAIETIKCSFCINFIPVGVSWFFVSFITLRLFFTCDWLLKIVIEVHFDFFVLSTSLCLSEHWLVLNRTQSVIRSSNIGINMFKDKILKVIPMAVYIGHVLISLNTHWSSW